MSVHFNARCLWHTPLNVNTLLIASQFNLGSQLNAGGTQRASSSSSMIVVSSLVLAPLAATIYASSTGASGHPSSSFFGILRALEDVCNFGFGATLTLVYSAFDLDGALLSHPSRIDSIVRASSPITAVAVAATAHTPTAAALPSSTLFPPSRTLKNRNPF